VNQSTDIRGQFTADRTRYWSLLLPVACCLLTASVAFAISDNAGTKNGNFLKIATDARSVALGPSIVSMAEGAESVHWNPAGLGRSESQEFGFTHVAYYQDVSIENINYAYPMGDSAVGADIFYLSPGSLEGRNDDGNQTGDFSFYDLTATVGYGQRLGNREEGGMDIYVGGALKVVQEKIDETSFQNAAVDLGLLAIPIDNLRAGLSIRNLSTHKANFPNEITGGLSYTIMKVFIPAVAVRYADDAPMRFNIAGEYKMPEFENSVLRVGYQSHDPLDDSVDSSIPVFRRASLAGLTMGAGMEIRPPMLKTMHFNIDYAMAPFGALGISHFITVKVKW
jgi:hypothetical protein